jgi:hypothetical protein
MPSLDPYEQHWKLARRRIYVFLATWLSFIPVSVLAGAIERRLGLRERTFSTTVVFVYCAFLVYTGLRTRVMCPRCGKSFTQRGLFHNGFTSKCLHCGLPRGATLAQVQSGTFEQVSFSWKRVFRLVAAASEIVIGAVSVMLAVTPGARREDFIFYVVGVIAFLFPGIVLTQNFKWRWWPQLLPLLAAIGVVTITWGRH